MSNFKQLIKRAFDSEVFIQSLLAIVLFILLWVIDGFSEALRYSTIIAGLFYPPYLVFNIVFFFILTLRTRRLNFNFIKIIAHITGFIVLSVLIYLQFDSKFVKFLLTIWTVTIPSLLIFSGVLYFFNIIKYRYKSFSFDSITKDGFNLVFYGKKDRFHRWEDFKTIKTNKSFKRIHLVKKSFGKVIISKDCLNWYELLKKIPPHFTDFDRKRVQNFFENLTPCMICGCIAVHDSECCVCQNSDWTIQIECEYKTKENYIKEKQLELFATEDKEEQIVDFFEEDDTFKLDKSWKPMVTEQEILDYSKKHYWNQ